MTFFTAGIISAGASIVGGLIQSDAASNAADTQAASTAAGIAEQRRQFDLTRGDFAPYREAGVNALGQLQTDINSNPTAADVMNGPGYQFGLQQGQQALDRKAAAAGGRISGAALKAASGFATNYATTGYGAEYQRRQDRLNRLQALAGIGQTSTGASAAAGSSAANAISGMLTSQGDSTAAAGLARGNIWGGVANQLGAIGQRWANTPGQMGPTGGNGNGGWSYGGVSYNNPSQYEAPG